MVHFQHPEHGHGGEQAHGECEVRGLQRPVRAEQDRHVGRAEGLPSRQGQARGRRRQEDRAIQESSFRKR